MGRDNVQRYADRHHQRAKYYCVPCDKVVKARGSARCPHCGEAMTPMGTQWRPGRQVHPRVRTWDRRRDGWRWPWPSAYGWPRPSDRVGRKRARARREAEGREPVPQHGRSPLPWWAYGKGNEPL
jgi:ribosomal protein S27AE